MSITKTGIISTESLIEMNGYINDATSKAYTPTTSTNSCMTIATIDFSSIANLKQPIPVVIECDINWTNFTGHSGNGTFTLRFQGANRQKGTNSFVWQGSNYICNALNNVSTISAKITSSVTGGTYHYITSVTIPDSWFDTYDGSHFGTRSDYSNGTGTLTVSNLKISIGTTNNNASIGKNYIIANNFYEY